MRPSIVVSTYNQPCWLEKVLWGYAVQTHRDFELVVADDGSGPETAATLARVSRETGLVLRHVWHEDAGFRKSEILNHAIRAATGDYLIFTDGDCIPRRDFVATHVRLAAPGQYLSGHTMRLALATSEAIGRDDVVTGRCFDARWLAALGYRPRNWREAMRFTPRPPLNALLDRLTSGPARFDGNNASAWRRDLEAVNGFELGIGYGDEDRMVGARLRNLGVRPRSVRYQAVAVHLEHGRGYVDPEQVARNKARLAQIRREGRETRAPRGLAELPPLVAAPTVVGGSPAVVGGAPAAVGVPAH